MNVVELPLRLQAMADALKARGAKAAADAMAAEFHVELVDVTLRTYAHSRGEVTPSPPFAGPPALVTGTMRRSARVVPAPEGVTRATASVRVGAVYARIQEKGGVVRPRQGKYLKFQYPSGKWHAVKRSFIPKRPYMAPTRERLVANGRLKARGLQAAMNVVRGG